MHEDIGHLFSIGAVVSWDVVLVDGAAEGWPGDVLVATEAVIEERPAFALHGSLARTPRLSACWRGEDPVGSRFDIRAGLLVDLFNPPFRSTATGVVQRIQIVTRRMVRDQRGVWNPSGTWQLADVRESPRWLAPIAPILACGRRSVFSLRWTSGLTRSGRSPSGRRTQPHVALSAGPTVPQ
jgi:hypothetical protein